MPSQGDIDVSVLEPDQRSSELTKDLPRAQLRPGVLAALWVLRIYVVIAVALIVYLFLRSLHS